MASRMKFIIIKGSADPAQSIVQDMIANSSQWHGSDAAGQAALSANNLDLGAQLMGYGIQAVRGDDGVWYVGHVGGEKLYDKYGGGEASTADPQTGIDATRLVTKVTIRGRKGSSARKLTAKLLDDDGFGHSRLELDVEQGVHCIFYWDGQELFRGIVQRQERNKKKTTTLTAYDNGIYLANNKDTFVYENKTASDVFRDCCTRFGLEMVEVASCTYTIPELTKPKTTAFDAICDALSLDYEATGVRHYVSSSEGKLSLLERRLNILQWVIEAGQNLSDYSYSKSIEDVKTRVKLISSEGTTLAEASRPELEQKIGITQEIQIPDENLTEPQIKAIVDSILEEKSAPARTLSVESFGIPEVISGVGVYIIIPDLKISRTFYVDEDEHVFDDNNHTMSLKLNYAADLSE